MMYHMKILHNQNIKMLKNKLLTHNVFQRTNKFITYKEFSLHMKQLNNDKKLLLMIFYTKKSKTLQNHFIFFNMWLRIGKTFTFMCIIQNMLRYYTKKITNVDILKPKIMKLTYTKKPTFNINGITIHFALAIPLNKNQT